MPQMKGQGRSTVQHELVGQGRQFCSIDAPALWAESPGEDEILSLELMPCAKDCGHTGCSLLAAKRGGEINFLAGRHRETAYVSGRKSTVAVIHPLVALDSPD